MLGPVPVCPHLATRWRQTAGDVAVYLAAHTPRTAPDQAGLPALIGSRPTNDRGPEWDQIADTMTTTAVAAVYRQLTDRTDATHDPELTTIIRNKPEWLTWHLKRLAHAGRLASPNLDNMAATIREVHRWRVEHRLVDTTTPTAPLGPIPRDPAERSRHSMLRNRLTIRTSRSTTRGLA